MKAPACYRASQPSAQNGSSPLPDEVPPLLLGNGEYPHYAATFGHSQPNVPAVTSAWISPSSTCLNVMPQLRPYQIEFGICARASPMNAVVPTKRNTSR